ncbi:sugar transferase [Zunongwangia atlantica]|uniref:Undecaprenyl-phosphate glycosyl-1-phosphate transferase n=1 Tax=Zunongwangia atlantica 22II14-10F7 TaxID=1185767 RepID=A0A1Y1T740_9FLAO|nr:sugar transferase [Zunongwangia atlantica]ORL46877.1 undecaprenyl-phosphate glycosyl-1-phosphate transferase [Zunongwangia atlantica 22II14-10F7]
MYRKYVKSTADFIFALFTVVLFLPVFIIITLLILILDGFSPFFIQDRVGKDARSFRIYKFKTMNDKKDSEGKLLKEELRVTPLGRILRQSGLDEIPQLFNILKFEMSFIGPRPLPVYYIDLEDKLQRDRHRVLPGITGLAQITGRNSLKWPEKYRLDNYYIENHSFWLDLKILLKTIVSSNGYDAVNFEHVISEKKSE